MQKFLKQLNMAFALVVISVLLCCTSFAESGALRVTVKDENKKPVSKIEVELCKVADYSDGRYTLTDDFASYVVSGDEISDTFTVEQAERVYQYVLSEWIEGEMKVTNNSGSVDFTGLTDGIYLVFERGGQKISFQPYLVKMPYYVDGNPVYSFDSMPKTVSGDTRSVWLLVQWDDEESRQRAASIRPESVEFTLYRDGTPVRKVALNEACAWQHTFHLLPFDGEYSISKPPVENYTLTGYIEVHEGFMLMYSYTPPLPPDEPDDPDDDDDPDDIPVKPDEKEEDKLPQTGFELIPVYLMMGVGALMVLCGMADLYLGREDE